VAARIGARPLLRGLELLAERARLDLAPRPRRAATGGRRGARADPARASRGPRPPRQGTDEPPDRRRLVISVKTVGIHVSQILCKPDVPTRVKAARSRTGSPRIGPRPPGSPLSKVRDCFAHERASRDRRGRRRLGRAASARRRAIGARPAPASVTRRQRRADCPYPCVSTLASACGVGAAALLLSPAWSSAALASERNRGCVPSRSSPCSGARLTSWSAPLGRRALTSTSGSERVGGVAEVDG
jgi:hypothetical protein